MTEIETYRIGSQVENFLRNHLGLKRGSYSDRNLKGFYERLVRFEEGKRGLTASQYQEELGRARKYFLKLADKSSNIPNQREVDDIKEEIPMIEDSGDFLSTYHQLKNLL